jgi:hypothetical protein
MNPTNAADARKTLINLRDRAACEPFLAAATRFADQATVQGVDLLVQRNAELPWIQERLSACGIPLQLFPLPNCFESARHIGWDGVGFVITPEPSDAAPDPEAPTKTIDQTAAHEIAHLRARFGLKTVRFRKTAQGSEIEIPPNEGESAILSRLQKA